MRRIYYCTSFVITILSLTLLVIYMGKNGVPIYVDSLFHINRIYEIRQSFLHLKLPTLVNLNSFFCIGQAINGMYPDISLWPFVLVTIWLPFKEQIVMIKVLILLLTILVTYLALSKRGYDKFISIQVGILYGFSGYSLFQFVSEFQPGTAIIYIFSFEYYFLIRDICKCHRINKYLILKSGLLFTIVLYSHLLTSLVLMTLTVIYWAMVMIEENKFNTYFIINSFLGSLIAALCSLPVIVKTLLINRSGIAEPYGKGQVGTEKFFDLFSNVDISSRISLSIISLILILIALVYINKKIEITMFVQLVIMLLCTNIAPWFLISKLPLFNMMQFAPWRFGIWLSILPIVAFLYINETKFSLNGKKLLLTFLVLIATLGSLRIYKNDNKNATFNGNPSIFKKYNSKYKTFYSRVLVRDYSPREINGKSNADVVAKESKESAYHPVIKTTKGKIHVSRTSKLGEVDLNTKKPLSGKLILPIYGYSSLLKNYKIFVDGYRLNSNQLSIEKGWICLNLNGRKNVNNVKIKFQNPMYYYWVTLISLLMLLTCIILYYKKSKYYML
jgi:hypothetical protein